MPVKLLASAAPKIRATAWRRVKGGLRDGSNPFRGTGKKTRKLTERCEHFECWTTNRSRSTKRTLTGGKRKKRIKPPQRNKYIRRRQSLVARTEGITETYEEARPDDRIILRHGKDIATLIPMYCPTGHAMCYLAIRNVYLRAGSYFSKSFSIGRFFSLMECA